MEVKINPLILQNDITFDLFKFRSCLLWFSFIIRNLTGLLINKQKMCRKPATKWLPGTLIWETSYFCKLKRHISSPFLSSPKTSFGHINKCTGLKQEEWFEGHSSIICSCILIRSSTNIPVQHKICPNCMWWSGIKILWL